MGIEGEGVLNALLAHQGETGGIHKAEGVIGIAMQDLIGMPFQMLGDEQALQLSTLPQRIQETLGRPVPSAEP